MQPSQFSSQSLRIFLRSRTFSFFRSTADKSICFSEINKYTHFYRHEHFNHILRFYEGIYCHWYIHGNSFVLMIHNNNKIHTETKVAHLSVFFLELFTHFQWWHWPTQWFRHFTQNSGGWCLQSAQIITLNKSITTSYEEICVYFIWF